MKKYQIIYADPPWKYQDKSKSHGGGAESHYPCLSIKELCALPIPKIADENCVLFLWTTMPMLEVSFEVIKAWGFTYKTCAFTWVKRNNNTSGFFMGMGRWTRGNAELCLLATKGKPKRMDAGVRSVIDVARLKHSQKPDIVKEKITTLMGLLPRIELFARQKTEGWDVWGNEVKSDIELTPNPHQINP
jgi:N6-adenosine-specific RNA methylase IME4